MSDLVEQALAARDRVAAGWCQHAYGLDADGNTLNGLLDDIAGEAEKVCVLGATVAVTGSITSPLAEALDRYAVSKGLIRDGHAVGYWNDNPNTTQAMAVGLMDDFATWLKEQA